jgi:DNA ligase (NAD+)
VNYTYPDNILIKLAGLNHSAAKRIFEQYNFYYFIKRAGVKDFEEKGLIDFMESTILTDFFNNKEIDHDRLNHINKISIQQKTFENIIQGIEKSKLVPFERVLFGLGIRYVGETVAKKLAKKFKNIDRLKDATIEEMTDVEDIGIRIAESIKKYFSTEKHLLLIEKLKNAGLNFEIQEKITFESQILSGLTFVVSGNFGTPQIRENLKNKIEELGGKVSSGVTGNTDFLIAGEKAGPDKISKAKKLNIKILNKEQFEEEFKIMI